MRHQRWWGVRRCRTLLLGLLCLFGDRLCSQTGHSRSSADRWTHPTPICDCRSGCQPELNRDEG
ncbi:MAG: hypothetical protein AVDCRST_MAG33-355 [uncultured Thermomicrobiales bacterium]|uniref:Uncharacterized protein n=1 Tax=uncultured Thermomicrobiales bacterium TaxID=1645740 RepID=A0A6J4UDU1_9BACT|nr:MAG: hypothetical protein AVDCRST_MAG33-355 [uncultured Thermomicrobiales bacterium]